MKVCIPVIEDHGFQSQVNGHFGSAPVFIVVDIETGMCKTITNNQQHHQHGQCNPVGLIGGENVDCVVVAGIGANALSRLQEANIRVYLSDCRTVEKTIEAFKIGALQEMTAKKACSGSGHGGGPCKGH
jgi:predicted Fe-Mo cluster-binding NifX family protein